MIVITIAITASLKTSSLVLDTVPCPLPHPGSPALSYFVSVKQFSFRGDPLNRRSHHPYLAGGGFKTVALNVYGWSALVGVGLALGIVALVVFPATPWFAFPAGVIVTWLVLVAVDRQRWRAGNGRVTEVPVAE